MDETSVGISVISDKKDLDEPIVTSDTIGPMHLGRAVLDYMVARRPELDRGTRKVDRCILMDLALALGPDRPVRGTLTQRRIEMWRAAHDWKPATGRRNLSRVRMFCRWLVQHGYLKADPTLGLKAPRQPTYVPRGLGRAEVRAVFDASRDERDACMWSLDVQEGLRAIELSRIEYGHIQWITEKDGTTYRTLFVQGKGQRHRVVPLSAETCEKLDAWLVVRGVHAGPLFVSYTTGNGLTPNTISNYFSQIMYAAGVKLAPRDGKSGHAGRHTAATDMLRNGAHIIDVQAALGHADIGMTRRYLPALVGDLRDAMGGRRYSQDPTAEGVCAS